MAGGGRFDQWKRLQTGGPSVPGGSRGHEELPKTCPKSKYNVCGCLWGMYFRSWVQSSEDKANGFAGFEHVKA